MYCEFETKYMLITILVSLKLCIALQQSIVNFVNGNLRLQHLII